MNRPSLTATLAAGALVPASAGAATVTVDRSCYREGAPLRVDGRGFTAGSAVSVGSEAGTGLVRADATGAFTVKTVAPTLRSTGPGTDAFVLTATDRAVDGLAATATIRVARFAAATSPLRPATPATAVRWRVSGFVLGRAVYAHYVLGGRQRARARFGVASAPCGTLRSPRLRTIPVTKPAPGSWTIQIDQSRSYRRRDGVPRGVVRVLR